MLWASAQGNSEVVTDVKREPKAWDVGLPCVRCGLRVLRGNGFYCRPVKGLPWARHGGCRR